MSEKKVIYKEPNSYFTAGMLKAAKDWDKQHAAEQKKSSSTNKSTKKK